MAQTRSPAEIVIVKVTISGSQEQVSDTGESGPGAEEQLVERDQLVPHDPPETQVSVKFAQVPAPITVAVQMDGLVFVKVKLPAAPAQVATLVMVPVSVSGCTQHERPPDEYTQQHASDGDPPAKYLIRPPAVSMTTLAVFSTQPAI